MVDRLLRLDLRAASLDRCRNRRAAGGLRSEEFHVLAFDQSQLDQFVERLLDLDDQRSASHGADDVIRQAPAELFGDFETDRLRSLGIVGTQVHVDEAPAMFVGDLRAESVDLIVVPGDAHDFRAEHIRAKNLRGLEVGWNKDPGLQPFARGVRGDGVGQVSGRGARHGVEPKLFRLRQRDGDHAVFKTQSRQADCVVLDIEIVRSCGRPTQLRSQAWSLKQRSEADRQPRYIALGEG